MPATDRPLRADAERNRRRVLEAAGRVFAERGLAASLDDVAAAAGVGVGTVYRRFPCKDDLVDALFEERIGAIEALARTALEAQDPWEGFAGFLRGAAELHARDRGMREVVLAGDRGREHVQAARARIAPLAAEVLRRAQAAGAVRADVHETDLPLLQFSLGHGADLTREAAPDWWQRGVCVLLDGLRARPGTTPMTVAPLAPEQFVAAMARRGRC